MKTDLTREEIIDLLYYLGASKVVNRSSSNDIPRAFKKNDFIDCGDYLKCYTDNGVEFLISKEDKYLIDFRYFGMNGYTDNHRYLRCKIYEKRYLLHNLIMRPKEGYIVDHINGNTLDNRRDNLRVVLQKDNCLNRKTYKNSKHRGVSKTKNKHRPYVARIQVEGKSIYLGAFTTLEEAIKIREEAEKQYFRDMRREG